MKILFLSEKADNYFLASRMLSEGHEVYVYVTDRELTAVESWRPYFKNAELIICDGQGFGKYENLFREYSKPTIACSLVGESITTSMAKSVAAATALSIPIPQTLTYSKGDPIEEFTAQLEHEEYLVALESSQPQILSTNEIPWLLQNASNDVNLMAYPDGSPVGVEGWFNGSNWLDTFFVHFTEKSLLPGSGPRGSGMGTLCLRAGSCRLTQSTLEKFTEKLRAMSYRGPVSIDCSVTETNLVVTGIKFGLSFGTLTCLAEGMTNKASLTDLLYRIAMGIETTIKTTHDLTISVSVWNMLNSVLGCPISISDAEARPHIQLNGATRIPSSDREIVLTTIIPIAGVTARGRTPSEARSRVYRTLENLWFPTMTFRHDIGKRESSIVNLTNWDWL